MAEIIVVGAGAIGRGFLPWALPSPPNELVFVDRDRELVRRLRRERRYATYRTARGRLERLEVPVAAAYSPREFRLARHRGAAAAFVCVGPRGCAEASRILAGARFPVVVCENDPGAVDAVKKATGLRKVYFGIPDVIVSNTAPARLHRRDPLAVVSEKGVLFLDERLAGVEGAFTLCAPEDLRRQWTAKLFLHNTPHCVAGYLGALAGVRYIHQAMARPAVRDAVAGTMAEMLKALRRERALPPRFLEWYARKELARFKSKLLCDPVSRVVREPLRKLETGGRLVGAAQLCLEAGFVPKNLLAGIDAALRFAGQNGR